MNQLQAARWLGVASPIQLTSAYAGNALAASTDGSTIVGGVSTFYESDAFKWTSTSGTALLPHASSMFTSGWADAMSSNASTIVGTSGDRAAMWRGDKPRLIETMLQFHGVTIPQGWILRGATGVSADGTVIAGWGINPQGYREAWRAVIPYTTSTPPGSCAGYCGQVSPDGCWCDENCAGFGDCCEDVCIECQGLGICGGLTCAGICGDQAPGGCWCDFDCCAFEDCCPDHEARCGPCPNSCKDLCGKQAPAGCWCNDDCCKFGDCCPDKPLYCDGCAIGSCVGFCGGQAPGGCWCDEACCGFLDCCPDKFEACGGCWPSGGGNPADITGDGAVNVADLLGVINAWGTCPVAPAPCAADIAPTPNGDGTVNVLDLLMVINNWS